MANKYRCPYCGCLFEGRLDSCPNCYKKLRYIEKPQNSNKPPKKRNGGKVFLAVFIPTIAAIAGISIAIAVAVSNKKPDAPKEKYQVTWVNYNGDVLEIDNEVEEGSMPSYDGVTPTKPKDAQYTYTFTGWTPQVTTVKENVTYTATYSSAVNKYTITWIVENVSTTQQYEYGAVPSYGSTPYKAPDAQYTYAFTGWDKTITPVTGDTTYTALFNQTYNTYTISFVNDDGSPLYYQELHFNDDIVYQGPDPYKAPDAQYTYTFIGWDSDNTKVIGNQVFTAQYSSEINYYEITWSINGNSYVESYPYGASPSYTGEVIKEADAQYTYSFSKWSPDIQMVISNQTYTAIFDSFIRSYTVTFNVEGVLTNKVYEYGQMPSYDETPVKQGDAQYTYTFIGWDKSLEAVTQDVTYVAVFSQSLNSYTISWDVNGTVTQESYVYGGIPTFKGSTFKASDNYYDYTFIGWDHAISEVTGDETYVATYTSEERQYAIHWFNYNGSSLGTTYQTYDSQIVYNGLTPQKEEDAQYTYTFSGWDKELGKVTGDASFTATFTEHLRSYTITFMNEGEIIQQSVEYYGDIPQYNGASPTKDSTVSQTFSFAGWDHPIAAVTGDATYTATYEEHVREYTITWSNYDSTTLKVEQYEYGATPIYSGETPTKPSTTALDFTFVGWSPEITSVSETVTYVAQFDSTPRKYTITWYNYDNSVLDVEQYEYGAIPSYKGETPTRDNTDYYIYTFEGWDRPITAVLDNAIYIATYSAVDNSILSFSYNDLDMTAVVIGVDDLTYTNIEIPDTFRGYEVIGIGNSAFKNCTQLVDITIPNSILSIGDEAFMNCNSLATIDIPDSVTSIGDSAFEGCTSLEINSLPDSIYSLGSLAFKDCDSLAEFNISKYLLSIGEGAFNTAINLGDIDVDIDNPNYRSIDGVVYSKDNTKLIYCPHDKYTSFEVSSVVTYIANYAFYACDSITEVSIPDTVNYIGKAAFKDCAQLTEFTCPTSVTEINESTFENCESLYDFTLGTQVTSIGNNAFAYCRNLNQYIGASSLPEGLLSIGDYAFYSCSSLILVFLPDSITSIGTYAFAECTSLLTILFNVDRVGITRIADYTFFNDASLSSIWLPDELDYVGRMAFGYCTNLLHVYYGTINIRHDMAFYECSNLVIVKTTYSDYDVLFGSTGNYIVMVSGYDSTSYQYTVINNVEYQLFSNTHTATVVKIRSIEEQVTLESTLSLTSGNYTVNKIGGHALNRSSIVETLNIPSSVKRIEKYAFMQARFLKAVNFSEGLEYIGSQAFQNTDLTEVVLPNTLTTLEENSFIECSKIKTVKLSDSMTTLTKAFNNCGSIEKIIIPDNITKINTQALYSCHSITTITIPTTVTVNNGAFYSNLTDLHVYYHGSNESEWNSKVNLGDYNTILTKATRYYYSETSIKGCWHYIYYKEPVLY